jgi:hypothetical protein
MSRQVRPCGLKHAADIEGGSETPAAGWISGRLDNIGGVALGHSRLKHGEMSPLVLK